MASAARQKNTPTAELYRHEADRVRKAAANAGRETTRQRLLLIVENYEKLARSVERLDAGRA